VREAVEVPVVAWEAEPVAATADEAMARAAAPTRREEAAQWLKELLSAGAMPYREIAKHAREAGFALHAIRDAKSDLGVAPYHVGYGTRWAWCLPGQRPAHEGGAAAPCPAQAPEPVATGVGEPSSDPLLPVARGPETGNNGESGDAGHGPGC